MLCRLRAGQWAALGMKAWWVLVSSYDSFSCFEPLTLLKKSSLDFPVYVFWKLNYSKTKHSFNLKEEELPWHNWHQWIQESQSCCSVILDIFSSFLILSFCLPDLWQMKSVVLLSKFPLKSWWHESNSNSNCSLLSHLLIQWGLELWNIFFDMFFCCIIICGASSPR